MYNWYQNKFIFTKFYSIFFLFISLLLHYYFYYYFYNIILNLMNSYLKIKYIKNTEIKNWRLNKNVIKLRFLKIFSRVFQEMLYGIQAGFGSPQVPVAELLARPVPTLFSPQKPRSSNFLQVPDVESPRFVSCELLLLIRIVHFYFQIQFIYQ